MNTTAVFAELVVGGLQTLAWLAMLLMLILGVPDPLIPAGWAMAPLVVLLLAAAYVLGVLFDRVWDSLLKILKLDKLARGSTPPKVNANDVLRSKLFSRDARLAVDFVDYTRCRMRIARASMFNLALMTLFGSLLTAEIACGPRALVVASFGAGLTLVSILAYVSLSQTHERSLLVVADPEAVAARARNSKET